MYSGNTLSDYAPTDPYGRNNVFRSSYKMFQDLQTTPDLTQVNATGDTSFDMTDIGSMLSTDVITAKYGGGVAPLIDLSQALSAPNGAISDGPFTFACLGRSPNDADDTGYLISVSNNAATAEYFTLRVYQFSDGKSISVKMANSGILDAASLSVTHDTNWHFYVGTYTAADVKDVYRDTVKGTQNTTAAAAFTTNRTTLGAVEASSGLLLQDAPIAIQDAAILSEVISDAERKAMYNNYMTPAFYSVSGASGDFPGGSGANTSNFFMFF